MDSLQARTAAMRVLFKSDMAGVLAITGGDEFEGIAEGERHAAATGADVRRPGDLRPSGRY